MARGTTLGELITGLRIEVGDSTNPATGQNVRDQYIHILNRTQDWLYHDFDWPYRRVWSDKALEAGKNLYDFPDDIDVSRIETVWMYWGDRWHEIMQDLDPAHYNEFDSDAGEEYSPPLRWLPRSETQFEVWPTPARSDDKLRFVGIRKLTRMVDDADKAILDDTLITLFAASEILASRRQQDADAKRAIAQRHYRRLRGRLSKKHPVTFLGQPGGARYRRPFGPIPPDFYANRD